MKSITIEPKISGTSHKGKLLAMYVLFQEGVKAAKTLHFERPIGFKSYCDHVNVDVDCDQNPIGVEIIFSNGMIIESANVAMVGPPILLGRLFCSAVRLAAIVPVSNPLQPKLLQDVVDRMQAIVKAGLVKAVEYVA